MVAIFCKLLQRKTYDIVSHRQYFIVLLLSLIALAFAAFHFGEASLEWSQSKYQALFSRYKDNIAKSSLEDLLCQYSPIDVVYTWVNGSDTTHLENLALTITQLGLVDNSSYATCTFSNCVRSPHMVLVKSEVPDPTVLQESLASPFHIHPLVSSWVRNNTFLVFSSSEEAERAMNRSVHNHTLHPAFITDTPHFFHTEPLHSVLLGLNLPPNITAESLHASLPHHLYNICDKVYLKTPKAANPVAVVVLRENHQMNTALILESSKVKLVPAHLVIFPATGNENVAPSRFADNEELKFSLRSLEKYAPWVRHIYIVTNGQIPSWLNLDHPRVFIVTHQDIFPNSSHLPTFSSPAIESHLHRIPGLSLKFLYLNDDVLFGSPVLPEDFYTPHHGFKVRLSWPVPPCAEGCPASWISDHFCDQACNNSQCHWDGGDCSPSSNPQAAPGNGLFQFGTGIPGGVMRYGGSMDFCNSNCPNSWLNDHYCDVSCNTLECAFDVGDCGVDNYPHLPHWDLLPNTTNYLIPPDAPGMYFNLSTLLSSEVAISKGKFDGGHPAVRTMALNLKLQVLTVLLRPGQLVSHPLHFTLLLKTGPHQNETDLEFVLATNSPPLQPTPHSNNRTTMNTMEADIKNLNLSLSDLPMDKRVKIMGLYLNQDQDSDAMALKMVEVLQDMDYHNAIVSLTTIKTTPRHTQVKLGRRHLMDTFGDSLRHVNRLYDLSFGLEARKVPAHIAHLVDVKIQQRLQSRFPGEFDTTSSHKIRTGGDMQFAFSNFYFLMDEKRNVTLEEIFTKFDMDQSGEWSEGEVHTLWTHMFDIPLDEVQVREMEVVLSNCSTATSQTAVNLQLLQDCPRLSHRLLSHFGRVHANKFEVLGEEDVTFVMVPNNQFQAAQALDKVLKHPRKFICINDNLDHGSGEAAKIQEMIQFIYETILPHPSQFELDPEYQNLFLTVKELRSWQRFRDGVRAALYFSVILLLVLSVLAFLAAERPRTLRRDLLPQYCN